MERGTPEIITRRSYVRAFVDQTFSDLWVFLKNIRSDAILAVIAVPLASALVAVGKAESTDVGSLIWIGIGSIVLFAVLAFALALVGAPYQIARKQSAALTAIQSERDASNQQLEALRAAGQSPRRPANRETLIRALREYEDAVETHVRNVDYNASWLEECPAAAEYLKKKLADGEHALDDAIRKFKLEIDIAGQDFRRKLEWFETQGSLAKAYFGNPDYHRFDLAAFRDRAQKLLIAIDDGSLYTPAAPEGQDSG